MDKNEALALRVKSDKDAMWFIVKVVIINTIVYISSLLFITDKQDKISISIIVGALYLFLFILYFYLRSKIKRWKSFYEHMKERTFNGIEECDPIVGEICTVVMISQHNPSGVYGIYFDCKGTRYRILTKNGVFKKLTENEKKILRSKTFRLFFDEDKLVIESDCIEDVFHTQVPVQYTQVSAFL